MRLTGPAFQAEEFEYVDAGPDLALVRLSGTWRSEMPRGDVGLVAWLAWLFVHIMFLIGFRNRFLVLFEWAWAYLSWQRGARLAWRANPELDTGHGREPWCRQCQRRYRRWRG